MSHNTHARANEDKLEKDGPTFVGDFGRLLWKAQVVSEILEGCFHLSKSQPSLDS